MQGKFKVYHRNIEPILKSIIKNNQSCLMFGPRQTGKTTIIKELLHNVPNVVEYPLQHPHIRQELEKDPGRIIKQIQALKQPPTVFIDEAQKIPELFDAAQYLIDNQKANFIISGSSARKLRKKGINLLPGRVKSIFLDPLSWNEINWLKDSQTELLAINNIDQTFNYSFEDALVFGTLPGIINQPDHQERGDFLKSYTHIYLEEEIRQEALSRNIGGFSRFLELSARESGNNTNYSNISQETGLSIPTIKEYYQILSDTLIVERLDPYINNPRKRILSSARYYFFDTGVRNALARFPLDHQLLNIEKGRLFEHAVILELIRRNRILRKDYRFYYWRTNAGAEVDLIIDTGTKIIPIEIKSSKTVKFSQIKGLISFLNTYPDMVTQAYVIADVRIPEKLNDNITVLPWNMI